MIYKDAKEGNAAKKSSRSRARDLFPLPLVGLGFFINQTTNDIDWVRAATRRYRDGRGYAPRNASSFAPISTSRMSDSPMRKAATP
jgi:hypothetical protein